MAFLSLIEKQLRGTARPDLSLEGSSLSLQQSEAPLHGKLYVWVLPTQMGIFDRSQCAPLVFRRRTNVQQLTCKIDLSNSFYYLFFSFVLLELKPFVFEGEVLGEKL